MKDPRIDNLTTGGRGAAVIYPLEGGGQHTTRKDKCLQPASLRLKKGTQDQSARVNPDSVTYYLCDLRSY